MFSFNRRQTIDWWWMDNFRNSYLCWNRIPRDRDRLFLLNWFCKINWGVSGRSMCLEMYISDKGIMIVVSDGWLLRWVVAFPQLRNIIIEVTIRWYFLACLILHLFFTYRSLVSNSFNYTTFEFPSWENGIPKLNKFWPKDGGYFFSLI